MTLEIGPSFKQIFLNFNLLSNSLNIFGASDCIHAFIVAFALPPRGHTFSGQLRPASGIPWLCFLALWADNLARWHPAPLVHERQNRDKDGQSRS